MGGATLDGSVVSGSVVILNSGILQNLTITGGRGTPIYNTNQSKNFTCGGGVLISDDNVPSVIRNCRITGNQARDMGGGISILTGNPTIRETTIDHNRAGANEGGIFVYSGDATILNTTITLNTLSGDGGVDGYKGGGGIAVFYSGIGGTCRVISSTVVSNDCCSKDHGSEICTQGQVSLDCSLV